MKLVGSTFRLVGRISERVGEAPHNADDTSGIVVGGKLTIAIKRGWGGLRHVGQVQE